MVTPTLHKLYPLVGIALVACTATSLEDKVRAEGLAPASIVRLADDLAVVARRDDGGVRVMELAQGATRGWTMTTLAASSTGLGNASARLLTAGGDTGTEWNTYLYGTAPSSVSRVVLEDYDARGGQVVAGAWVLVLRETDLTPDDMDWQFVDALGRIVDSGTGIFPPG
jgi:hypothetical protein